MLRCGVQETALEDGRYEEAARLRDEFKASCMGCFSINSCQSCRAGMAALKLQLGSTRVRKALWRSTAAPLPACCPYPPACPAGAPQGAAAVVQRDFGDLSLDSVASCL